MAEVTVIVNVRVIHMVGRVVIKEPMIETKVMTVQGRVGHNLLGVCLMVELTVMLF